MSYFDDASLVMIPSGYKDQKVYSVKPLDGSGDLTFSRASSATRVASNGLIEKVRTNLQTYSQDFSATGGWGGDPVTATKNYGTAPDGTQTSTRLQFSSANYVWQQSVTGINGNLGVFSLYIKGTAGETIQIAYGGTDKLVTIGTGWTRVNTNGTVASTGTININTYGGTARDFEVWGGQTELGDIATDYIATTSAAVSVGPVSGLPRLDYLNSTCPRLILEPQRTNSQTYSEQINNAAWGLSGVSVSANNATSPDGYTNADKIVESAANARHEFYGVTTSFSGNNAVSFFAKAAGRRYICALEPTGAGGATFDLQTGTVATVTAVSASIENYGNGWYRCSVIINKTASTQIYYALRTTGSVGIETYTGDGTSGVLFYGAQTELSASYATSYIPTLGTSVTRVADAASKTSANNFFGTNTGTIVINFDSVGFDPTQGNYVFDLAAGVDAANRILVYFSPSDSTLRLFYARTDGTNAQQSFIVTMSAIKKVAVKWTASSIKMFYNGTATNSFAFGATAPNDLTLFARYTDNEHLAARTSQVLTFPTALTDAQCIELTTL